MILTFLVVLKSGITLCATPPFFFCGVGALEVWCLLGIQCLYMEYTPSSDSWSPAKKLVGISCQLKYSISSKSYLVFLHGKVQRDMVGHRWNTCNTHIVNGKWSSFKMLLQVATFFFHLNFVVKLITVYSYKYKQVP